MDNWCHFTAYGFLHSTRESKCDDERNQNTQSSEYIIIYEDELYIVSTTPEEILHMLQDKYKINIYLQHKHPHDPGGRDICQCQTSNILKSYIPNFLLYADFWHTSVEVLLGLQMENCMPISAYSFTVHILHVTSAQHKPLSPKVSLFW